jgi:PEP-CTERM motif
LPRPLASVWLAFLVATNAAPSLSAPFSATLSLGGGGVAGYVFGAGSGSSAPAALTIPSGTLTGGFSFPITGNPPLTRLRFTVAGHGAGSFSGTPLAGRMPVYGVSKAIFPAGAPLTLFAVPLFTGHAIGSAAEAAGLGLGNDQRFYSFSRLVDVQRNLWRVGTAKVTGVGVRERYTFHRGDGMAASQISYAYRTTRFTATETFTGSDARTPGGLGQITLVSPTRIQVRVSGEPVLSLVVTAELALNFVPEPSTLVLLGAGTAVLAALGGRRLRR